jgi:hypothetical protein
MYTPSPEEKVLAETWVNTHDCTVADMIAIDQRHLASSATAHDGQEAPVVTIKRNADLERDLSTAIVGLRFRLPPSR